MVCRHKELDCALASGLGFVDDCHEFENTFFLQILFIVLDDVENEPSTTSHTSGSRFKRQFLFCNRELNHVQLFKDYFYEKSTYGPIIFNK